MQHNDFELNEIIEKIQKQQSEHHIVDIKLSRFKQNLITEINHHIALLEKERQQCVFMSSFNSSTFMLFAFATINLIILSVFTGYRYHSVINSNNKFVVEMYNLTMPFSHPTKYSKYFGADSTFLGACSEYPVKDPCHPIEYTSNLAYQCNLAATDACMDNRTALDVFIQGERCFDNSPCLTASQFTQSKLFGCMQQAAYSCENNTNLILPVTLLILVGFFSVAAGVSLQRTYHYSPGFFKTRLSQISEATHQHYLELDAQLKELTCDEMPRLGTSIDKAIKMLQKIKETLLDKERKIAFFQCALPRFRDRSIDQEKTSLHTLFSIDSNRIIVDKILWYAGLKHTKSAKCRAFLSAGVQKNNVRLYPDNALGDFLQKAPRKVIQKILVGANLFNQHRIPTEAQNQKLEHASALAE